MESLKYAIISKKLSKIGKFLSGNDYTFCLYLIDPRIIKPGLKFK